jgi:carbamoyl-phosphate synthase small subunit
MVHSNGLDRLQLKDGAVFEGRAFGFPASASGEVVFNTGMVGYPEAMTDPSYRGQILVLTYPLVGNYGVAPEGPGPEAPDAPFESGRIHIAGLVVSEFSPDYSHWNASRSLADWLREERVPAIYGVDTRAVTKHLRAHGSMTGRISSHASDVEFYDPNTDRLVPLVSVKEPVLFRRGVRRVVVVDCGCKDGIVRALLQRDVTVLKVPWDFPFPSERFDGVVISNGPGNPKMCQETITHVREALSKERPILGICLGHQLLALAAGAETYKMKFGHRSQNQPCLLSGTRRCYITSQNHGYAVDNDSLPEGWEPWFVNANDGTNEGIRHRSGRFASVQFHPEAAPGPVDSDFLFDEFVRNL